MVQVFRKIFLIIVFWGICAGVTDARERSLKILFVGNSYIYTNDLPGVLKVMLQARGYTADIGEAVNPGWKLSQHADSEYTKAAIEKKDWDYIVLQEQSLLPVRDTERLNSMIPAIRRLKAIAGQSGTRTQTVLFMTWGYKNGSEKMGYLNFNQMQEKITQGYNEAGRLTGSRVVPVGSAWQRAYRKKPFLPLWLEDGNHPGLYGTYLSACVLFKFVTGEDPRGLPSIGRLSGESAGFLQSIAAEENE